MVCQSCAGSRPDQPNTGQHGQMSNVICPVEEGFGCIVKIRFGGCLGFRGFRVNALTVLATNRSHCFFAWAYSRVSGAPHSSLVKKRTHAVPPLALELG